jgi:hypothetical protein
MSQRSAEDDEQFVCDFLTHFRADAPCDRAEGLRVARHILARLEEFLGLPVVTLDPLEDSIREGMIWMHIASPHPFGGGLGLSWRGILSIIVLEGVRPVTFGITLFLYSGEEKLITRNNGSFLCLYYPTESGIGRWERSGWVADIYGEFEDFDTFERFDPATAQH